VPSAAHGPAPRVVVLVGRGRYEDPWHDHAATAHRVAVELTARGRRVELVSLFPGAVGAAVEREPALLVVVAGSGRVDPSFDGDDADWALDHAALAGWADAGGPLLGLHCAANTFTDAPHWRRLLGGAWVPERSWHPPFGTATFTALPEAALPGVPREVVADDERYCGLVLSPPARPVLAHREGGRQEVVAWSVEEGPRRAVYDGLGHSTASYDSPSRLALLRAEVSWLLREPRG